MGEDNEHDYENDNAAADDDFGTHAYQMDVESKETSSLYFILFSSLLFGVLLASKYLHEAPAINKYLSEASLILLVGLVAGFMTENFIEFEVNHQRYANGEEDGEAFQRLISFSPNIFFMALLPPILFNSGYQLRRELFLQHIYPIVMFAVMGTAMSTVVCAMLLWGLQVLGCFPAFNPTLLELFAFGALIAATDTVSVIAVLQAKRVDPHLFYVVFGESALNDAVALALYNSFADLIRANKQYSTEALMAFFPEFLIDACCSPLLGMAFGFGSALLFKRVDLRKKKYRMLELSLYLMLMYVPFIIAESIHLSGIVTIFFAGLSVRRYVAPNVSRVTEKAGATIFQLVAFLSETCIFLELGLSIFGFSGSFHWNFIGYSLICCLTARAAAIYPLAFLHNFAVAREEQKFAKDHPEALHHHHHSHHHATTPSGDGANKPTTFSPYEPRHVMSTVEVKTDHFQPPVPMQYVPPAMGDMSADAHPQLATGGQPQQASTTTSQQLTPISQIGKPLENSHIHYAEGSPVQTRSILTVTNTVHTVSHPLYVADVQLHSTSMLTVTNATQLRTPPYVDPTQPTPLAHNLHRPPSQIHGLSAALTASPLHDGEPQGLSRTIRRGGTSFDSEDTHGSVTTATTHQSRKRRERRGRLMNNVKKERISWEMMHILWFAGLRGAVAYACVREFPDIHGNADEFTAATMFIVLFTIVVMGGLTESMLGWLKIDMGVDLEEYMDIFRQEQELSGPVHDFEKTYLYNVATQKASRDTPSPMPEQPPVFLGVDSNAFRSLEQQEYYNWTGFELQCFPGYDHAADSFPGESIMQQPVHPGLEPPGLPTIT